MLSFKQYIEEAKVVGFINLPKEDEKAISRSDLKTLEVTLDKLFAKVNIDIDILGKHFIDRINDKRNKKPITIPELKALFIKTFNKHSKELATKEGLEAVLNDIQSDINVPFVIKWDAKNQELDLIGKTVMRKSNFKTSNKKYKV